MTADPRAHSALGFGDVLTRLADLESQIKARDEEITALKNENKWIKKQLSDIQSDITRIYDKQDETVDFCNEVGKRVSQIAPSGTQLTLSSGKKTDARIEALIEILKRKRGRSTFSELREEMNLSKSQFSQLIRQLDNRIFDVQRHPRKPKEKILILRQQIGRRGEDS